MGSERFPECFDRFEQQVDIGEVKNYRQLEMLFRSWAGRNWKDISAKVVCFGC
jgi:hypothetical protein